MRKTQQAEQIFRLASNHVWYTSEKPDERMYSAEAIHHGRMAAGMELLAQALRDIYDKLEALHEDVRKISGTSANRMSVR